MPIIPEVIKEYQLQIAKDMRVELQIQPRPKEIMTTSRRVLNKKYYLEGKLSEFFLMEKTIP